MTSKEAYRVLQKAWESRNDSKDYPDFDDINEALDVIEQSLERKEKLEQENEKLKNKALAFDVINHIFNISLDSKLRICDDLDEVQSFLVDLPDGISIDKAFSVFKEVLDNAK